MSSMYCEWTSLKGTGLGDLEIKERSTVLERLPPDSAKEVVLPVVRHIVATLGISQPAQPSAFTTDVEVEWAVQVICYGLSLPLTEHEIIKDCASIYCEWISCLTPAPKISVPKPVTDRPNFFARKMIKHLYHLFTPRKGEAQDIINRQAVLCHRVLRTLQNVMKSSETLDTETWECVLLFLIAINDALLSPPSIKEDIGDQLCERVLSVLFEVWLLACSKSFPSPPLWKTLRESCQAWRHRPNLFEQWNRINLVLVGRVLTIMYDEQHVKIGEDDGNLLMPEMSNDCIVQTWFRFLQTVGNPVELTKPTLISQTQNFLQFAIASQAVVDPCQHPCLFVLPSIFHQAMKGVSALVDAFLGLPRSSLLGLTTGIRSKDTSSIPSSTNSSLHSTSASITNMEIFSLTRPALATNRPKVNSILHLFGLWLFEAALISCESSQSDGDARRTSRGSAVPAALPESIDIPNAITIDKYYQGRAEALGTLCRIFCSKKTGEEILPAYLARFYIALRTGLKDNKTEVLASILSNSPNLLRIDLDGVSMLVPSIVSALEAVLPSKESLRGDLRRSAIQLLLSILPLPLHFMNVQIKDLMDKNATGSTFIQLKPRLANLLINSLQAETDSLNIQMLLGGLLMFVLDTSTFEETDKTPINIGMESPTNLLSSENTSMRSLSEYSNSFDEHTFGLTEPSDTLIDSAHALFVRATYLVCHGLISTWKADLPVSLAALELLNGLARTKVRDQDPLECRRAIKWICDFIIHQCGRPPQAHSRDLHSSIVASFQCVTTWLTQHPYILEDKESLVLVLEVVELGISGTKSQGKPGEALKLKDEKELKPVSLRVRDAAEALLAVIFEQVGRYTPTLGARASSLVDEFVLLNPADAQVSLTKEEIVSQFRYFVVDHSVMLGLFEEPLGNEQDPKPTITAVLRGPTGRHAWTLQLRHMPRYKGKSFSSNINNQRPLPMNDVGVRYEISPRYFPESVDRITQCKADEAIPPLDSSNSTSDPDSLEQNRLSIILENQIRLEKSVANMIREESNESYPNTSLRTEAVPPPVSQTFQTSRLLLSHLGFISVQNQPLSPPKLLAIDSRHADFITELDALDSTSPRTFDTVHLFYVRAGQRKCEDILANVQSKGNVHPHFLEFLLSLGWPVSVNRHVGWTGNISTSWKRLSSNSNESPNSRGKDGNAKSEMHGGSLYNGENQVLYWEDVTSEISFVVPTGKSPLWNETTVWTLTDASTRGSPSPCPGLLERSMAGADENTEKTEKTFREFEKHLGNTDEPTRAQKALAGKLCDTKIFVVWLESFEDAFHFPAAELLDCTYTGSEGIRPSEPSLIIFIHSLRNGLFRIHMEGQTLRMGFPTPLINGMVLSRRVLGNLVRQTALNMARRKRLENENFQPPHVRRKLKIQEILQKFPCVMSEPDFYTHFFDNPATASCSSTSATTT